MWRSYYPQRLHICMSECLFTGTSARYAISNKSVSLHILLIQVVILRQTEGRCQTLADRTPSPVFLGTAGSRKSGIIDRRGRELRLAARPLLVLSRQRHPGLANGFTGLRKNKNCPDNESRMLKQDGKRISTK